MKVQFPYQINPLGQTLVTHDMESLIRDVIEDLLFTKHGERINLPSYGSGLEQLVFEPLSEEITASAEMVVQANLIKWLTNYIDLKSVAISTGGGTLKVTVDYLLLPDLQPRRLALEREMAS